MILGLHPKTVIRLFRRREIPAFRPGGKLWRTSREAVDDYVAAQMKGSCAARSASLCRDLPRGSQAMAVTTPEKD